MASTAARSAAGDGPFVLDRADAYIGVLIDDLVTLGTAEPYRMFTSRAEYRLLLRADNADQRLTPKGTRIGCVSAGRGRVFAAKEKALRDGARILDGLTATPNTLRDKGMTISMDGVRRPARELLAYPGIDMERLAVLWPEVGAIAPQIAGQLEIEARYAGYLERQDADIRAFRRDESLHLPADLDFDAIPALSTEARCKLAHARPATLGAAARISGVTPAALTALLAYVRRANGRPGAVSRETRRAPGRHGSQAPPAPFA